MTLLLERPLVHGAGTDLSPAALEVARANARRYGVLSRLTPIETSWWQAISGYFDLVVSNPPYIPHAVIDELEPEVRNFDPPSALDGGPDGLEAIAESPRAAVRTWRKAAGFLLKLAKGKRMP